MARALVTVGLAGVAVATAAIAGSACAALDNAQSIMRAQTRIVQATTRGDWHEVVRYTQHVEVFARRANSSWGSQFWSHNRRIVAAAAEQRAAAMAMARAARAQS